MWPPPIWRAQTNLVIKPPKQTRVDPTSDEGLIYFMNYYSLIYLPLLLIEFCYVEIKQLTWSSVTGAGPGREEEVGADLS